MSDVCLRANIPWSCHFLLPVSPLCPLAALLPLLLPCCARCCRCRSQVRWRAMLSGRGTGCEVCARFCADVPLGYPSRPRVSTSAYCLARLTLRRVEASLPKQWNHAPPPPHHCSVFCLVFSAGCASFVTKHTFFPSVFCAVSHGLWVDRGAGWHRATWCGVEFRGVPCVSSGGG